MSQTPILITGGTGFAGSHLVEALLAKGETNIHVTNFGNRPSFVTNLLPADQIHSLDLTDGLAVTNLLTSLKPEQIYHLAATAAVGNSFDHAQKIIDDHSRLQINLLEAVRKQNIKTRILAIGSALEYDTTPIAPHLVIDENYPIGPVSPYAVSKTLQTLLALAAVRTHHLDIVMARPFNHIGERQGLGFVVADFAAQIVRIEQGLQTGISVGNLAAERDFTDVRDMVQGYIILMNQGKTGQIYNLGSNKAYAIQMILNWLIEAAKIQISVTVDPNKFRPLDIHSIIADNDKVCSLGWQPTENIKPTVLRILDWWRLQSI